MISFLIGLFIGLMIYKREREIRLLKQETISDLEYYIKILEEKNKKQQ